jgi:hypothetical protein
VGESEQDYQQKQRSNSNGGMHCVSFRLPGTRV